MASTQPYLPFRGDLAMTSGHTYYCDFCATENEIKKVKREISISVNNVLMEYFLMSVISMLNIKAIEVSEAFIIRHLPSHLD